MSIERFKDFCVCILFPAGMLLLLALTLLLGQLFDAEEPVAEPAAPVTAEAVP